MTYEMYLAIGRYVGLAAIAMLVLDIVLLITLRIPAAIDFLFGVTKKKEIKRIMLENEVSAKSGGNHLTGAETTENMKDKKHRKPAFGEKNRSRSQTAQKRKPVSGAYTMPQHQPDNGQPDLSPRVDPFGETTDMASYRQGAGSGQPYAPSREDSFGETMDMAAYRQGAGGGQPYAPSREDSFGETMDMAAYRQGAGSGQPYAPSREDSFGETMDMAAYRQGAGSGQPYAPSREDSFGETVDMASHRRGGGSGLRYASDRKDPFGDMADRDAYLPSRNNRPSDDTYETGKLCQSHHEVEFYPDVPFSIEFEETHLHSDVLIE